MTQIRLEAFDTEGYHAFSCSLGLFLFHNGVGKLPNRSLMFLV